MIDRGFYKMGIFVFAVSLSSFLGFFSLPGRNRREKGDIC